MKCWKCDKEMEREDGGATLNGVVVTIDVQEEARTQADIEYYNKQLGKYSDGNGKCYIGICYECYIDGLFNLEVSLVECPNCQTVLHNPLARIDKLMPKDGITKNTAYCQTCEQNVNMKPI